ncbi:unnamed protein product [Effrenium voratum]|nr:unnamed protein product [Effrenium voratum]
MASSSEGEAAAAYDDDFEDEDCEDASDNDEVQAFAKEPSYPEEAAKAAASSVPERPPRPPVPEEPSPREALPDRVEHRHAAAPVEKVSRISRLGSGAMLGDGLSRVDGRQEEPESGRTFASAPSSGRRVVRGKISVSSEDVRPGTGDSGVTSPPVKDSRPLWLRDEKVQPAMPQRPDADLPELPEPGRGPARRARPGAGADGANGTGADDPRKVKRLQQEIQRLSQRLAESEMYSAQDDGLPKFTLEEVEVGNMIAQGGFASVHIASWQSTPCALKKIFDPVLTDELKAEFENEVRMLRRLRHPNVVTLMAVCRKPPALSILTELVPGGSLYDLMHCPGSRSRDAPRAEPLVLLPLIRQAGAALAYLHAMMVIHRDIKSQNVLLTEGSRPVAKLCDFGLARMRSELCTGSMQWAGTAPYMAPELFQKRRYDQSVDVFAFGTMIWEVASGEIPHANMDVADIAHRAATKEFAGLAVPHSWPKQLKTLLRSTLSVPCSRLQRFHNTQVLSCTSKGRACRVTQSFARDHLPCPFSRSSLPTRAA